MKVHRSTEVPLIGLTPESTSLPLPCDFNTTSKDLYILPKILLNVYIPLTETALHAEQMVVLDIHCGTPLLLDPFPKPQTLQFSVENM